MTQAHPPEIIDLTECTPSPEVIVIEISDGDAPLAATTARQEPVSWSPRKRRKKPKPTARETRAEELPVASPDDGSTLFFIDVNPTSFPDPVEPMVDANGTSDSHDGSLLLPPHASLVNSKHGEEPVEIPLPFQHEENGDYIEYLDYDDSKVNDFGRYFDDPEENVKAPKIICKRCGAEGEHRTSDCLVETCWTCGARDEHRTLNCPISKICFHCGMRGHVSKTCPNPFRGTSNSNRSNMCDRCGSTIHQTNECPTLWRLYDYHSERDRQVTLRRRRDTGHLHLGNGGEAYIADDEWCYNCGKRGHWGDDCNAHGRRTFGDREPSAFSTYNMMAGPFSYLISENDASSSQPKRHDREAEDHFPDGWGADIPLNVGKRAKAKEKSRREKRAREQAACDRDDDDWFDRANRRDKTRNGKKPPRDEKGHNPGLSVRGASRNHKPSLLDRISDIPHSGGRHNNQSSVSGKSRRPSRKELDYNGMAEKRHNDGDRDWNRRYDGIPTGPRYKGGYSR